MLRYDIYTIEKLTMTAVAAHRSLGDARLMVLIGGLPTLGDLTWIAEEAIAGGADVIQYRDKGIPDRELLRRARELRIVTARARVPMIMNDRPDLARLAGCDGVHLGQEDVSIRDARRILGAAAQIGVSTHDREQLDAAVLSGAAYLGVGPVFPSPTKEFSEPELAGLSFVRLAAETTALPWFAIGGIDAENVERVLEAGARGSRSAPRSSEPRARARGRAAEGASERTRSRRRPGYGPRGRSETPPSSDRPAGRGRESGRCAGRLPVGAPDRKDSEILRQLAENNRLLFPIDAPPEGGTGDHDDPRDPQAQPPSQVGAVPRREKRAQERREARATGSRRRCLRYSSGRRPSRRRDGPARRPLSSSPPRRGRARRPRG